MKRCYLIVAVTVTKCLLQSVDLSVIRLRIVLYLSFSAFIYFRNILEHCLNCYGETVEMDTDSGWWMLFVDQRMSSQYLT